MDASLVQMFDRRLGTELAALSALLLVQMLDRWLVAWMEKTLIQLDCLSDFQLARSMAKLAPESEDW